MNRDIFSQITQDRIVILDGATGTLLQRAGMPTSACTEQWVCDNPEVISGIYRNYLEAGSDIIYAATFGANRARLEHAGLADEIVRFNTVPVQLARQLATPGKHLVAGDISMTTMIIDPDDEEDIQSVFDVYQEQAEILAEAGCELLVVETMINLTEAEIAVRAARKACDLPIMVTLTYETNGYTLYGDSPEDAAKRLEDAGADAVGANCSTGPEQMLPVIEKIANAVKLPVIAKPNAGIPLPGPNGTVHYDMTADAFAVLMSQLIEAGASLVGGCCGTSPEYIQKLSFLTQNMSFESRK